MFIHEYKLYERRTARPHSITILFRYNDAEGKCYDVMYDGVRHATLQTPQKAHEAAVEIVIEEDLTNIRRTPSYDGLKDWATSLSALKDTDYVEGHEDEWEAFDRAINFAYDEGKITAEQFDELALTAFYDYQGELKGVYDDD